MDLGSITAAFGSIKAAGEVVKGLMGLHTLSEVQAKAIELNEKIISAHQQIFTAQTTQTELIDRVRELEGEITRMKNWDAEKQRYELVAPFPGCMVYALKKSMGGGQPPHYLCTSCFQRGQPSILQGRENRTMKGGGIPYSSYSCPVCNNQAFTQWTNVVAPQYFEDIKPPG